MSSHFGQRLALDLVNDVADFYNDLSGIISDFADLDSLILPFLKTDERQAVFVYEPETPKYHLKQNYVFPLALPTGGSTKLRMSCSGSCCRSDSWFSLNCGLFNYARTGTDEFQLTMNRLSSQTREGFVMKIPSNC